MTDYGFICDLLLSFVSDPDVFRLEQVLCNQEYEHLPEEELRRLMQATLEVAAREIQKHKGETYGTGFFRLAGDPLP